MPDDQAQILAELAAIADPGNRKRNAIIIRGHEAQITAYRMAKTLGMSPSSVEGIIKKSKETQS